MKKEAKLDLIALVIDQIKNDLEVGDITAIEELFMHLIKNNNKNFISFLDQTRVQCYKNGLKK